MKTLWLAALLILPAAAGAQAPAGEARAPALCDRLAGAAREQCALEERERAERLPQQRRELAGSCDALVGPDKEQCLRKGGTVEAGAQSGSGRTRPPDRKQ